MQSGKFNFLGDAQHGSSGKGLMSTYLADKHQIQHVSSGNGPNAGHTAMFRSGTKFIAKVIPTSTILKKEFGRPFEGFLSPGSLFKWTQLFREWEACGRPELAIHERASVITQIHREREMEGSESTKHIASTMQGTAAAMVDKILRKKDCLLAGSKSVEEFLMGAAWEDNFVAETLKIDGNAKSEFLEKVRVLKAETFRGMTRQTMVDRHFTWLHEGSQGYALSIDHGSHYPNCTSRNCNIQSAMDQMAIPPALVGDIYMNVRTYPIRVGNVVEAGVQQGYSGDFYPDQQELTWEEVGLRAGMPAEEQKNLLQRELTTVTKRQRRVATFSEMGLRDAVLTNGATKLCVNFIQYIDWNDAGIRGGREVFDKLSKKSRDFIAKVEETANVPVVLIGTGALHDQVIDLENT